MCSVMSSLGFLVILIVAPISRASLPCTGGRSVRALQSIEPRKELAMLDAGDYVLTESCCDKGSEGSTSSSSCHGGFILPVSELLKAGGNDGDGEDLLRDYAQLTLTNDPAGGGRGGGRPKRSALWTAAGIARCCPTNVSVFFPVSAISAFTGERVQVIQAPPLIVQPVTFGRCVTERSSVLAADCQQDYVPEMMHIARVVTRENPDDDEGGWPAEVAVALEPVLVENSCSCRLNNEPIISLDDEDEDVVDSFLGGLLAATSQ